MPLYADDSVVNRIRFKSERLTCKADLGLVVKDHAMSRDFFVTESRHGECTAPSFMEEQQQSPPPQVLKSLSIRIDRPMGSICVLIQPPQAAGARRIHLPPAEAEASSYRQLVNQGSSCCLT